jgi:acetyl-CoA C-acetyltransferase
MTSSAGMTLDRFCGGGITSVNLATAAVMSGMEDCVIAGGTEMMSYTAQIGAEEANAGPQAAGHGFGQPALDAIHPQSPPGRLRRCDRRDGRHHPRGSTRWR